MSIEFRCPTCSKQLRVSSAHAGKSARCPNCQMIVPIPESSSPAAMGGPDSWGHDSLGDPAGTSPESEALSNPFAGTWASSELPTKNPYASPTSSPSQPKPIKGPLHPQSVSFDEVFSYAWELWKRHLGVLVGAELVVLAIQMGLGFFQGMGEQIVFQIAPNQVEVFALAFGLLTRAIQLFLAIGMVRLILDLVRTGQGDIRKLFSGVDCFFPALGAFIMYLIALGVGLLLLIVPGILVMLMFWGYFYQIVDRRSTWIGSFSEASEYCRINMGTSFLLGMAMFGIQILGALACCVGLIVSTPLVSTIGVVAYLKMSGQIPENARP